MMGGALRAESGNTETLAHDFFPETVIAEPKRFGSSGVMRHNSIRGPLERNFVPVISLLDVPSHMKEFRWCGLGRKKRIVYTLQKPLLNFYDLYRKGPHPWKTGQGVRMIQAGNPIDIGMFNSVHHSQAVLSHLDGPFCDHGNTTCF